MGDYRLSFYHPLFENRKIRITHICTSTIGSRSYPDPAGGPGSALRGDEPGVNAVVGGGGDDTLPGAAAVGGIFNVDIGGTILAGPGDVVGGAVLPHFAAVG